MAANQSQEFERNEMQNALARRLLDTALAMARQYKGAVTVSVVDAGAHLVLLHRSDGAALGTVNASIEKARSSVLFGRPTSVLEKGGWQFGTVSGLCAVGGGVPVISEGRIIGGVGVSGLTPAQDDEVAKACSGPEVLYGQASSTGKSLSEA